ncbi:NAD(P)/FAD-dependent oxidoreductase [Chondromyces apiculatus]|uniref:Monooxygenase, FAD-binding protein n=1 Tax=Chondromyces apiculatus DSM 436 TaxID=1192034 RepID=A0A017THN1_9BACT|nr:NAD(P)/FAD-dependent oxidoreductase [Chondromyces apiculatus]EYF08350.1 monooxygenase, FAD-binding protein [Chondromyces apiculatus DSM 436]
MEARSPEADTDTLYDVIIVGGRPAGASLAARLGKQGLSVLVVDKATFPSPPEVPSSAVIYPSAMRLLDEIGVDESQYADACARIETGYIEFEGHFIAHLASTEVHGRDYFYGLDRAGFDHALWRNLERFPSVTALSGITVADVVRDDSGRVVGVVTSARQGEAVTYRARICVIGADGRHSRIARKVGAKVVEDRSQQTSTVYFAPWEDVAPIATDGKPALHIVNRARGETLILQPTAGDRMYVAVQVRADRVVLGGDPEGFYDRTVRSFAVARNRLANARRVGNLLGVTRIANRYLEHGGPGWALVGDALHHKDPLDGQGIYDALATGRRLATVIVAVHEGHLTWEQALAIYRRGVDEETLSMFRVTVERLQNQLYGEPSPLFIRTMLRWLLNDPEYQRRHFMFLGRALPPDRWMPPWLMMKAAARGVATDVGRALGFGAPAG